MRTKLIILTGILTFFTSCDCGIYINGKIISSVTGNPIKEAKIEMINKDLFAKSDANGIFRIGEMTGFCYSPKIRVSYNNHKPFIIELDSDKEFQVYKLKSESEYIEFDKPFYPNPNNHNTFITSALVEKYSQNFEIKSDSLIIYLDEHDLEKEINQ